jgi:hypothetical protein
MGVKSVPFITVNQTNSIIWCVDFVTTKYNRDLIHLLLISTEISNLANSR